MLQMFVRHLALRKLWSTILPIERKGRHTISDSRSAIISQVGGVNSLAKSYKNTTESRFNALGAL